jgi:hypothetical protein
MIQFVVCLLYVDVLCRVDANVMNYCLLDFHAVPCRGLLIAVWCVGLGLALGAKMEQRQVQVKGRWSHIK